MSEAKPTKGLDQIKAECAAKLIDNNRKKEQAEREAEFVALFKKRKKVGEFEDPKPDDENPNAIFKEKFLRRGQMLLINSVLGIGKSTFVSQGSECWALGYQFSGLVPARPLKVGIFETEDDADEVADFRNNFRKGLKDHGWDELNITMAESSDMAPVYYPIGGVGTERFLDYLDFCTKREKVKPDLVIINPAYDFIDGDFSKAEDVRRWKEALLLIAERNGFAVILVHHTNKVPSSKKERDDWLTGTAAAYSGSGSMVLPSSARAVFFIRPCEKTKGVYEVIAAKRGGRLGWRDADGNKTDIRYMAHSADYIYWREATSEEIAMVKPKPKAAGGESLPIGVQRVIDVCTEHGRPFDSVKDYRDALMLKYSISDTTADNWLNKAIDAAKCRKVNIGDKGNSKVMVGLVSQFGGDDE